MRKIEIVEGLLGALDRGAAAVLAIVIGTPTHRAHRYRSSP